MSDELLFELKNVSKSFVKGKEKITIFDNLNMSIAKGDFLAIMGPSGSGKTTLLNMLGGVDRPTGGDILFDGSAISGYSEGQLAKWRADHVGFIFQFYNLMPVLTAFENVELPLLLTQLSFKERQERVELALIMVGLSDRMEHYPSELSGGQQQRVAIARAFISDPVILVADEPTGDLDRASAGEILAILDRLNKEMEKTIIMVTHDPHAAKTAHLIRHLEKGELDVAN